MNTLLKYMDNGHEILDLCRDAQLAGTKTIFIVPASMTDDIETESRGRSSTFIPGKVYYVNDHYISTSVPALENLVFFKKLTSHELN